MKEFQIWEKTLEETGDAENGPKLQNTSHFVAKAPSLEAAKLAAKGLESDHYIVEFEDKNGTTFEKYYMFEDGEWSIVDENSYPTVLDQEAHAHAALTDLIPGGVGDRTKFIDVDPVQLLVGSLVEVEHTKDIFVALEISKDHLTENKDYYKELLGKVETDFFEKLKKSMVLDDTAQSTLEEAHRWSSAAGTEFDALTKSRAETFLRKIIHQGLDGVHRDTSWKPIHDLFERLEKNDIQIQNLKTEYYRNKDSSSEIGDGKKWSFEIPHTKGGWYVEIVASFMGPVSDPSAAYDIIASTMYSAKVKPNVEAAVSFADDDDVMMTYNLMTHLESKILGFFKAHNLEWEPEECITFGSNQECLETAGVVFGKFKDVMSFVKMYHPKKADQHTIYITKV